MKLEDFFFKSQVIFFAFALKHITKTGQTTVEDVYFAFLFANQILKNDIPFFLIFKLNSLN